MAANDKGKPSDAPASDAPTIASAQPFAAAQPVVPPIPAKKLDESQPGGRFLVNGVLVNSEGQPINEDGSLKKE
jgi:hypothetical protein